VSEAVVGRSPGQIAWRRLKRDKVAMAGGVVVVGLVVLSLLGPYTLVKWFGHPPDEFHENLVDITTGLPVKPFGGIDWARHFLLGVEPINGRDLFSRIVYGGRVSLLVALAATALAVVLGVVLGIVAGYLGGWVDTLIARTMDMLLAFPVLLFAIALAAVDPGFIPAGRIGVVVFVIGFFSWPYIGRVIRGQVFSLREKEFVEAARSLGAGTGHILFRQILPNLWGPILVYASLILPTNILFEAALSFLGAGVQPPTPSWGKMLADAAPFAPVDPAFMIVPGVALFVTVLAFNLFGDGLRDALDPRGIG
jgi:ABC-type dipeptide/oligopeptide/nickel transport system permease subunit